MRSLIIIAIGLLLLAAFILVGRRSQNPAKAALAFIPLWAAAAGVNLWIGVSQAGYSLAEEAPVFLLIFGIPAAAALIARRRLTH